MELLYQQTYSFNNNQKDTHQLLTHTPTHTHTHSAIHAYIQIYNPLHSRLSLLFKTQTFAEIV